MADAVINVTIAELEFNNQTSLDVVDVTAELVQTEVAIDVIGQRGPTGPQGAPGAPSIIPGPTGPAGAPGATGATGAPSTVIGPTGPTGPTGPRGVTGAASTVIGPTGPTGASGPTGATGVAGPPGSGSAMYSGIWNWTTNSVSSATAGQVGNSSGTAWDTNFVHINEQRADNTDLAARLATVKIGDLIRLQHKTDSARWASYQITGIPTDQGTWWRYPVILLESGGNPPNNSTETLVSFTVAGESGATGPTGPAGGPTGPTGPTGPAGSEGVQGIPGIPGSDGSDGVDGVTGATGPAGSPGTTGLQGVQGITGATGPAGPPGEVGPAGLNYRGDWSASTAYLKDDLVTQSGSGWYCKVPVGPTGTLPSADPTHWSLLVLQGASGPTGPQGIQGAAGAPGGLGPTGSVGPVGPTGSAGQQGNPGSVGPTGPTGVQGPRGDAGPSGGGTLSGTLNGGITAAATTISAVLSQEWPNGPINNHILIDNELLLITNAVLVSGQTYTLTVQRGRLGTTAASHNNNRTLYLRPPVLATNLLPANTATAKVGTSLQAARADHDHGITAGGGGGASDLNALTDVTLLSPTQAQTLAFDAASGQWKNVSPPLGPTGPTGATGMVGPTGSQGNIGNTGLPGASGSPGPTGPTGSAGQQGIQGVQGPSGPTGAPGIGSTGPAGGVGATGPTGPTGPAGAGGGTSTDEVWLSNTEPTDPDIELWVDLDAPSIDGLPTRATASFTTASLAAGASESGTVTLAKGYRLLKITTSAAARVRLYTTTAKRDADAARAIGTDPTGDHGCALEFVTTAGMLSADLTPTVDGFDGKTTPDGAIAYHVTNTGAGAAAITVQLLHLRTE